MFMYTTRLTGSGLDFHLVVLLAYVLGYCLLGIVQLIAYSTSDFDDRLQFHKIDYFLPFLKKINCI